ncbi:MAG: hypothetical protein JSS93_06455 [Bacteroidetes bacterium]|nr:hypothetical protein [Bacteroidota bacterium]
MNEPGLNITDALKQVKRDVFIESGEKQLPSVEDNSIGGDFYFTSTTTQTAHVTPIQSGSVTEIKPSQGGRFSVGFETAFPMGSFADVYKLGLGGSVRYEVNNKSRLNWIITAGYLSFSPKFSGSLGSFSMIPIQSGVKYYVNKNSKINCIQKIIFLLLPV